MEPEQRATVVTGATGFLRRELLAELLASPGERIVTPLRPYAKATDFGRRAQRRS